MPTLLSQAPSRSLDQRLDALDRANRIRVQRAQLKRALKSGDTTFDQVLVDPPDYVLTAKVYDMLLSVPRLGRVRAGRLLTQCRISQAKTIGGLARPMLRGIQRLGFKFTLTMAAYDLIRLPKLIGAAA